MFHRSVFKNYQFKCNIFFSNEIFKNMKKMCEKLQNQKQNVFIHGGFFFYLK